MQNSHGGPSKTAALLFKHCRCIVFSSWKVVQKSQGQGHRLDGGWQTLVNTGIYYLPQLGELMPDSWLEPSTVLTSGLWGKIWGAFYLWPWGTLKILSSSPSLEMFETSFKKIEWETTNGNHHHEVRFLFQVIIWEVVGCFRVTGSTQVLGIYQVYYLGSSYTYQALQEPKISFDIAPNKNGSAERGNSSWHSTLNHAFLHWFIGNWNLMDYRNWSTVAQSTFNHFYFSKCGTHTVVKGWLATPKR